MVLSVLPIEGVIKTGQSFVKRLCVRLRKHCVEQGFSKSDVVGHWCKR